MTAPDTPTQPTEADTATPVRHGYCARCHPDPLPQMRALCGTIWDRPPAAPAFTPPPNACVVCLDLRAARSRSAWACPGCGR